MNIVIVDYLKNQRREGGKLLIVINNYYFDIYFCQGSFNILIFKKTVKILYMVIFNYPIHIFANI